MREGLRGVKYYDANVEVGDFQLSDPVGLLHNPDLYAARRRTSAWNQNSSPAYLKLTI